MISRDKFEKLMKRYNEAFKSIQNIEGCISWHKFKIVEYKTQAENHKRELEEKKAKLKEQEFILEEIRSELGVM